jgi:hypothetical protein
VITALNFSSSVRMLKVPGLVRSLPVADGVSTSKYSILAGNANSGKYFIESLLGKASDFPRDGPQKEVLAFFIPAYIKVLVGDGITYDRSLIMNFCVLIDSDYLKSVMLFATEPNMLQRVPENNANGTTILH